MSSSALEGSDNSAQVAGGSHTIAGNVEQLDAHGAAEAITAAAQAASPVVTGQLRASHVAIVEAGNVGGVSVEAPYNWYIYVRDPWLDVAETAGAGDVERAWAEAVNSATGA